MIVDGFHDFENHFFQKQKTVCYLAKNLPTKQVLYLASSITGHLWQYCYQKMCNCTESNVFNELVMDLLASARVFHKKKEN